MDLTINENVIVENDELQQKHIDFNSIVVPNYALFMTKCVEESEDLVQDTMFKAFRYLDNFQKGTNAKAWLHRIMINTFINNYREKRKKPPVLSYEDICDFYEYVKEEEIKSKHSDYDAFDNVFNDEIVNALIALPDDFRTIIFLKDIEGYTYEEIADFTGTVIGTVRSRLHRARKMLYNLLFNYAQTNGFYKTV